MGSSERAPTDPSRSVLNRDTLVSMTSNRERQQVPEVILLRRERSSDRYLRAFHDANMRAVCEPVLDFRFPHRKAIARRLAHPEDYSGLVATSPRAVRAVAQVLDVNTSCADAWHQKRTFAVGPSTAQAWRTIGMKPEGDASGSATALAAFIAEEHAQAAFEAPLLFVSGNRRRDALPEGLTVHNVPFIEQEAYVTVPRTALDLPCPSEKPIWLIFFSPSGREAVAQSGIDVSVYRIGAIGPTTATALQERGWTVEAVAEHPSPQGVLDAITAASTLL